MQISSYSELPVPVQKNDK